jgi:M6 family metalloprotease-like protein
VPKGKVESAIYGTSPQPGWGAFQPDNIVSFLSANSGNRFTFDRAGLGIAGWYDTDKNWKSYYEHDGSCIDNYDDGGAELHAEALRHADGGVDFSIYDIDGDGELTVQELAIVIVIPREDGDGSAIVPIYGSTCGANTRLTLDGVVMPAKAAKWNTSLSNAEETFQFTTGAHELLHLVGGLDDLHLTKDVSTYPGNISLMASNRSSTTHLDPFHKLAFGWVTPVRIEESNTLNINVVAKSNTVYVMPRYNNPWEEEFFIVENRKQGMGAPYFDEDISDSGIGVWHIVSDRKENQLAPIGTTQSDWDASHIPGDNPNSGGQMGRNGIRLIRPLDDLDNGTAVFNDKDHKLWDKADYALESGECFQIVPLGETFKNKLAWADCEASGYSLRFMDWSQETMQVEVKVN